MLGTTPTLRNFSQIVAPLFIILLLITGLVQYFGVCSLTSARGGYGGGESGGDWLADEGARVLREDGEWGGLKTLIIVAGHAVYTGEKLGSIGDVENEKNWLLESYQRGQVSSFVGHIKRGVEEVVNDTEAMLIFSGGVTRRGAGLISEGESYWRVAGVVAGDVWGKVKGRCVSEEFARDSWENLLFSVCRFRQIVGVYPKRVKVVSFEFKRRRFVDVHRKALRFPRGSFGFVGLDLMSESGKMGIGAGEKLNAFGPYKGDLYGCRSRILKEKKMKRNPFIRYHPYPQGCSGIAPLFKFCGRDVYQGELPWDIKQEKPVVDSVEG